MGHSQTLGDQAGKWSEKPQGRLDGTLCLVSRGQSPGARGAGLPTHCRLRVGRTQVQCRRDGPPPCQPSAGPALYSLRPCPSHERPSNFPHPGGSRALCIMGPCGCVRLPPATATSSPQAQTSHFQGHCVCRCQDLRQDIWCECRRALYKFQEPGRPLGHPNHLSNKFSNHPRGCTPQHLARPTKEVGPPKQKDRSVIGSCKSDTVTNTHLSSPLVSPVPHLHVHTHTHSRLM